jgi:hypothetical protein
MQVGGAHARALDLDQYLIRPAELRIGPLDQLERPVVLP